LKESGEIIGLLHDVGKASQEFQSYIGSATGLIPPDSPEWIDPEVNKGKVDHSTAGAQLIYKQLQENGFETAQALSLCIASHHSGLIDCLAPEGKNNFKRRMEKPEKQSHRDESWSNLPGIEKRLDASLHHDVETQLIAKLNSLKFPPESPDTLNFKFGLLVRYLLSCLIDADRLDTADFEFPLNERIRNYGNYRSWETLINRLDEKISQFESKEDRNEVDELRGNVSQACLDFSVKPKGVYQLAVPTGGGKTFSSLRFALNHANKHGMDRVFYIIPYTSIIDQNADEVRKVLEDRNEKGQYLNKVVLEHHSNIMFDDENGEQGWLPNKRRSLLSENWDAPIVFTTQVQFLEALFGSGTRAVRRMHQLANSVIIFDEVQTIPIRMVRMFNATLKFLVHGCGSTAVLCTATQPLLDKVEPEQHALRIDGKIIENEKHLYEKLRRVEVYDKRKVGNIGWSNEEIAELAQDELKKRGSVLIIVNTKKSALSLYTTIANTRNSSVCHLSTNMCPAHRLETLNKIKEKLNNEQPIICVSTQLIEAGVDIDFCTVIRYLAGLDSVAQAAGRCNRSGKQMGLGNVFIINPENESISMLKDIREGANITGRILREFDKDPELFDNDRLGLNAMKKYYEYYFFQRKNEMAYDVNPNSLVGRKDTLFNLLSRNKIASKRYAQTSGSHPLFLSQSFQTAARVFEAIDSPTRGVIVPYQEEGKGIVTDLCGSLELEKRYRLIKKAQRYSVNLYPHEFQRMVEKGAIREIQKGAGIFYLDTQYYSDEFGWSEEIVKKMEPLFC